MLSSIVECVVKVSPTAEPAIAGVLEAILRFDDLQFENLRSVQILSGAAHPLHIMPSWAVALSATVHGLRGWCDPRDVKIALEWMAANIDLVCALGANAPSY